MRRGLGVLGAVASVIFVCASACSSATGTSRVGNGSGGSGANGSGGFGAGVGDAGFNPNGGSAGSGRTCASDKYTGKLLPLDIFVMLDRSGSMQDNGKWPAVAGALKSFVSLSGISGIGMGIGFFPTKPAIPPPSGPCSAGSLTCGVYACMPVVNQCSGGLMPNDSCVDTDYAKPTVGIAPLPGAAGAITSAISGQNPQGASTPTDAAEHGAIEYAQSWAKSHPDDITIVVLATDGQPNNCNPNSVATVAARAAQGFSSKPSIKTFVIGVGSSLTNLDQIAKSGGTGKALIVSAGNAGQEFLAALDKIRGSVGCTLEIPQPKSNTPDLNQVNVTFTPDGGTKETFKKTTGESGCQGDKDWYYDATQTHIVLCPASCDLISNHKGVTDVEVGCPTILQ